MSRTILLFVMLLSLILGACGTRGPLKLPPTAKAPAKPENSQTTPSPTDLNTAQDPAQ